MIFIVASIAYVSIVFLVASVILDYKEDRTHD
jgi:hypothetical protein